MHVKKILPCFLLVALLFSCGNPSAPTTDVTTKSSAKAITSFSFLKSRNSSVLHADYKATINESAGTISVSLPYVESASRGSLVPTFSISSKASASPASLAAQDFSSPVEYTITAEDATTKTYTVTVQYATQLDSIDSSLSALALGATSGSTSSVEGFSSGTLAYSASVTAAVTTIYIKPTATYAGATITGALNDGTARTVTSGSVIGFAGLVVGANHIDIVVTAFDAQTTSTYVLNVDRGSPTELSVGSVEGGTGSWTSGSLSGELFSSGTYVMYCFDATVGSSYEIAIDSKITTSSIEGWTTSNGGWTGSPTATSVVAAALQEDGETTYSYSESPAAFNYNSTSYPGYFNADTKIRYVTIKALEAKVYVKVTTSSSYGSGTFAIQVRERTSAGAATSLTLSSWKLDSFPESNVWTDQDVPTYAFTAEVGKQYRIGIDDAYDSAGTNGWNSTDGGYSTESSITATDTMMRVLRADGSTLYAYSDDSESASSDWVYADYYNSTTSKERRYVTITAAETTVKIQVKDAIAINKWTTGAFAVQARPVIIAPTISVFVGSDWVVDSFSTEEATWECVKLYPIPVFSGSTYRIGLDNNPTGSYSLTTQLTTNVNWNSANGGYATATLTGSVKERIVNSSGSRYTYAEESDGGTGWSLTNEWFWADMRTYSSGTVTYQQRCLTVKSTENTLYLQVMDIDRTNTPTGTYAIKVRVVPEPVALTVDGGSWTVATVYNVDSWDIDDCKRFSFATTAGSIYYVAVDLSGGYWTSSNGGYSGTLTAADLAGRAVASDGSEYSLNGDEYLTYKINLDEGSTSSFWLTALEASVTALISCMYGWGDSSVTLTSNGTFAIKVFSSAP